MGLNIKSARAEAAIRELAAKTGEGLTEAVEKAVQERLERMKGPTTSETAVHLLQRLRPIQEAVAAERRARRDKRTSRELMDELYDEHGLPK
ncbi:MAG TPA: type II toxin-antitoxin system VapB family antitoxin [Rhizomicrobium sp.]|jgi:antitoxin VapB|nr:type II toxin-antitoxin system VapB family antitoxin [Rhizomicrobium sp.]